MLKSEENVSAEQQKEKIRARYKGISRDELEFIPAKPKTKLDDDNSIKRVAAYCRVSTDDPNQTSSYELQVNHYKEYIKEHAGWQYVDVYADEGISGTSLQHREEFHRLINDCYEGKIDLIVTKSVSRFARNIVDCIKTVRELANSKYHVGVLFETEHIYTLDGTSEMMLAVLSAAAQEESHTKSEIMNISIEQRFSRGIFLTPELLGFDKDEDGNLIINEEEAETVKVIFDLYVNGFATKDIAAILSRCGRRTKLGRTKWTSSTLTGVMRNERHAGDVLARKSFTPNYLTHKSKKNVNERNKYIQRNHHDAIVEREVFAAANKMLDSSSYKNAPLPQLTVIEDGALKGFVPVNRLWGGFTADELLQASEYAYEKNSKNREDEVLKDKELNLSGYQIVRGQFFANNTDPKMTISRGVISFNSACLKKFDDTEYVELLLNSVKKCIAIRPCDPDNPNAINWGVLRENRWVARPKSCRGFAGALFDMMEWDDDVRYRFFGNFREQKGEKILIFELEEPVQMKRVQVELPPLNPDNSGEEPEIRYKNITEYIMPERWANSFGRLINEGRMFLIEQVHYSGEWDVLRRAEAIPELNPVTVHDLSMLLNEAEEIIERWAG